MADITMPQLGETVTEGTITKWFKSVGDRVEEDEVLFEVSTDKVDSEVPSPAAGFVTEILVQEGDTVDVGTKLAIIGESAPSGGGGDGGGGGESQAAPAEEAKPDEVSSDQTSDESASAAAGEQGAVEPEAEPDDRAEAAAEPERKPDAAADDADTGEPPAGGPSSEAETGPADQTPAPAPAPSGGGGTRPGDGRPAGRAAEGKVLSPVVRRLIAEHDLDPAQIEGTGAGGRITRADVLAIVEKGAGANASRPEPKAEPAAAPADQQPQPAEQQQKQTEPATQPQPQQAQAQQPSRPAPAAGSVRAGERDEVIAFSNIRRRTAEHMVRSKATSAHVLTAIEVDYENVDRVRRSVRDRFKESEGISLNYLPFVCRAVVDAIREYPHVNASVGEDQLIVHHDIHLGIAVDLNFEGLLAPVIHDAADKRLRAIAHGIADLAQRARTKKLSADEISGGTFTITNPGPFGTFLTAPIINQPQVAILSTDGVKKRPVAVELPDGSDGIAVHPTGMLALSFDHRAIDGAYASAFIHNVKEILETRDWAQEL